MRVTLEHSGNRYAADLTQAVSIAIPLDFDGPQPNHFGANRAARAPLRIGGFVGRTSEGGSCNVDSLELTPHCNGTHTETISHIVNEEIWIGHAATTPLMLAELATVDIEDAVKCGESYRPKLDKSDRVVTAAALQRACRRFDGQKPNALIIRTKPNESAKQSRAYASGEAPAFLTVEAMQYVVQLGCRHLLVDLPSVDRMYDEGRLTNHHLFWNVPEGAHAMTGESWQDKTITEMVYVDDRNPDGVYLLNLQCPAFCSDAAPSRPIIAPARMLASSG